MDLSKGNEYYTDLETNQGRAKVSCWEDAASIGIIIGDGISNRYSKAFCISVANNRTMNTALFLEQLRPLVLRL